MKTMLSHTFPPLSAFRKNSHQLKPLPILVSALYKLPFFSGSRLNVYFVNFITDATLRSRFYYTLPSAMIFLFNPHGSGLIESVIKAI